MRINSNKIAVIVIAAYMVLFCASLVMMALGFEWEAKSVLVVCVGGLLLRLMWDIAIDLVQTWND